MNQDFNTDYKKVSQTLEAYIEELSMEKLRISVELRLARTKIQELQEEVHKLKSALESI